MLQSSKVDLLHLLQREDVGKTGQNLGHVYTHVLIRKCVKLVPFTTP